MRKKLHTITRKITQRIKLRTKVAVIIIALLAPIAIFRLIYQIVAAPPVASVHWKMDEAVGTTLNDATNNSNSGTITNALWRTKELCLSENCLYFDGSGDFVSRADDADFDFAASDSFTISMWFKRNTKTSGTDVLVAKHNGTAGGYKMYMESDGDITCAIDDDSTFGPEDSVTSTAATYDDNAWHHVACVKSGTSSLILYIDGNSVGTPDTSFAATGTLENANTFYIGIDGNGSSNPFTGFLDEFRLYRQALTAAEIKVEYNLGSALRVAPDQADFLSNGLAGYWPLDETSGNATDYSGNSTTLTNNSSTAYSGAKFGNGIEPDGTADYLEAPDNTALSITGDLTLSAWINNDDTTGSQNILGKWDGTNNSYLLALEGDELRMYIDSSSNYQTTTATNIGTNSFIHVAGVYSAATQTVKLYVNGVEQASSTTGTIPTSIGDDAGEFVIGADDSATNFFDGHIDEARVYNRALSPAEIQALYNWAPGPVGHWKFDENNDQAIYDSSGHELSGVLGNTTASQSIDPEWTPGKFGSALGFNGSTSNRYALVPDSDLLDISSSSSITISAWVRRTGDAEFNNPLRIVDKQNQDSDAGYRFSLDSSSSSCNSADTDDTGICFGMSDGSDEFYIYTLDGISDDGIWHHVSAVMDRTSVSNAKIYIDGIAQTTITSGTLSSVGSAANSLPLCIGINNDNSDCGTSQEFNGDIDDLRIYNYPRTAFQIIEDMNGGHPIGGSPIASQIAYWKLDDMSGSTAQDSGPNNQDLTLSASPTWTTSGKINGAIDFESGSSQYASVADSAVLSLTGNLSIAAWIKPESTTAATLFPIASKGQEYQLAQYGDEIRLYIGSTSNYATTNAANLSTDTWYHVVGTYNAASQTVKIFVNGNEMANTVTGTIPSSISDGTGPFSIGRYTEGTTYTFQVASTSDDGFETNGSSWTNNSGYDGFGQALGTTLNIGVRFNNVNIPQGSTISSAYLQVYGSLANTVGTNALGRIYADDVNDAAAWSSSSRPSQITQTTAFTNWNPTTTWIDGWMDSPDISAVISEVVNRPGWSSGNDLRLAILNNGSANNNAASFEDYTTSSTNAAKLVVEVSSTNNYYDGLLDEVQLYNDSLSADQIKVVFNSGAISFGVLGSTESSELTDGAIPSPTLAWTLDENTGTTANDTSGNALNGTLSNSPSWTPGKYGSGVAFAGSNQHIITSDNALLDFAGSDSFTIETWFKHDTASAQQVIVSKFASAGYKVRMESDGDITCGIDDDSTSFPEDSAVSTAANYDDNQWHHIACVKSGTSSLSLYIDGVLIATDSSISATGTLANTDPLYYGINDDGTSNDFVGSLDHLRIYRSALTPAQIAYNYNRGGPIGWWKFDECTGTTANNSGSGASINGTITIGGSGSNTSTGTCGSGTGTQAWNNGTTGKFNGSLDFDGTDDQVAVSDSDFLDFGANQDFTLAIWVKTTQATTADIWPFIMAKNPGGSNSGYTVGLHDSNIDDRWWGQIQVSGSQYTVYGKSNIADGNWHHLVFQREGSTIRTYEDGKLGNSVVAVNSSITNSTTLKFGYTGFGDPFNYWFDGQMDDARIYRYALSGSQIQKLYNEGAGARFGPNN